MVINKSKALTLLFATCVVTRIASTIYYIEDADSLRFALGILDYDVVKYQPHFPGYPVYCFLVKIFYFFYKQPCDFIFHRRRSGCLLYYLFYFKDSGY